MPSEQNQDNQAPVRRSNRGAWLFLLVVTAIYGLGWLTMPGFIERSLGHFVDMLKSILPILGIVMLLIGLLNLSPWMDKQLTRLSDRNSGLRGWLFALAAGVLSHGPIYAWYPLLQQLREKGSRPALLAAFLYARSIKLPFLPLMAHYFGLAYTVIVSLLILLFSILNGLTVEMLLKRKG